MSTSCLESAPASDLAAFRQVSAGFGPVCFAWMQVTGTASPSGSLVRRPALAVRCGSSGWSRVWLEDRLWERNWERWWERNLGEHSHGY